MSAWMDAEMPNLNKLEELPWVQEMTTCMQDPIWHGEGDVWTHTQMVLEALMALPEYKDLSTEEQFVLQWSAILHDIAKPATTETNEKGRIISPRHAKTGEKMARQVLWNMDIVLREQICSIVRLHGLPIWGIDKELPIRQVVLSSQRIPNKLLYLFAKADMLGRITNDLEAQLYKVELFKELCKDASAWDMPYSFENGHSAFRYFLKGEEWPAALYDDTEFEVMVLSGIAGSGKDTYVAKFDLPMISFDEIRKELGIKATDAKGQGRVAQLAYERAKAFAAKKKAFIWNSTNLTADLRARFFQTLSVYNPRFKLVYLETSYENILASRGDYIPKKNIQAMFRILEIPLPYEAHEMLFIRR